MVEIIGESADGFFVHPFHTPDHMEAETLPVLRGAAESAGRAATDVTVACLTIVTRAATTQKCTMRAKRQLNLLLRFNSCLCGCSRFSRLREFAARIESALKAG